MTPPPRKVLATIFEDDLLPATVVFSVAVLSFLRHILERLELRVPYLSSVKKKMTKSRKRWTYIVLVYFENFQFAHFFDKFQFRVKSKMATIITTVLDGGSTSQAINIRYFENIFTRKKFTGEVAATLTTHLLFHVGWYEIVCMSKG